MYVGIDLGTSGVKAVLVDEAQRIVGTASAALQVERARPLWSEQDPEAWWRATDDVMRALRASHGKELGAVRGIGLSGQMHGAVLLDDDDAVLRPAILWNDGRSAEACVELERREPALRRITGNLAMPGFTAPKLVWVEAHEPAIFARTSTVLLPKDYLRLRMTGVRATDLSDASGTCWLDVAHRTWSEAMLAATHLSPRAMPALFEGTAPTGTLRGEVAAAWGMSTSTIVAAGAGDNAAGAAGAGVVAPGTALLSLGTSGVLFVSNAGFAPNPAQGVHAFCHCFPQRFHQMAVILSAASALTWVTKLVGAHDEGALLAEVEAKPDGDAGVVFLPYLSGERTPHNDPNAQGVLFGLTHDVDRAAIARAVLEGVAFAFADGQDALGATARDVDAIQVIGGGARSALWGRILASALDKPLLYSSGATVGPAFGAARLGRLAVTNEEPVAVCTAPPIDVTVEPDASLRDALAPRRATYRALYQKLRDAFPRR
jgi:xylulokinase